MKKATVPYKHADAVLKLTQFSVDNAADAIFWMGADAQFVHVNDSSCNSLGYSREELLALTVHDIDPNFPAEAWAEHWQQLKQTGSFTFESAHRAKDGRIYPVEICVNYLEFDGKEYNCAFARNITKRKQVEKALKKSEERYHNVYNTAPIAFVIWDCDCRVTDWNKRAEMMFGWSSEEILGRNFFEFIIPEEARPQVEKIVDNLLQGKLPSRSINENLTKSGEIILCEWNNSIQFDNKRQIVGAISLALDITERKKAEEALRKNEKKYSTLVENSLTGIYIDQDEKIVFANRRFADIYGYPPDELLGIWSWKLVHSEDRALTNRIRAKRLKGHEAPMEYEARGLTKDGNTIWVIRRNTCIQYRGRPAILGNIVDISQQKWAEEELHKTNEELRDFVQVVTHDLKNPLVIIQGFSSRLTKHYQNKLGERGLKYLEHIKSSVRQMEVLVSDLLALLKIGRVVSSFENIPSGEIVKKVIQVIQFRLKEKKIALFVAENLPTIHCDGERIYQVFENLLVNATKFIGDTKAPKIEIGYEDRGNFHHFFVRDNGIGIDKKHSSTIFEKFRRLKEIEDKEGTGLGLAIVERIVTNHGGSVWVESEKGKGATFSFTLPKTT